MTQMTDEVRRMQRLAAAIDAALNGAPPTGNNGFALLVFPLDITEGDTRVNYVGNSQRESMLVALKELVARWEGRAPQQEKIIQ